MIIQRTSRPDPTAPSRSAASPYRCLRSAATLAILVLFGMGCGGSGGSGDSQDEPGVVEHFTGKSTVDAGQATKRRLVQSTLKEAVRRYRAMTGELPSSLEDLRTQGLLQSTNLVDEWGTPLRADRKGGAFTVRSPGPDREFRTTDDWALRIEG
jgi:hypothetical protein